jgi:hypothetical protein
MEAWFTKRIMAWALAGDQRSQSGCDVLPGAPAGPDADGTSKGRPPGHGGMGRGMVQRLVPLFTRRMQTSKSRNRQNRICQKTKTQNFEIGKRFHFQRRFCSANDSRSGNRGGPDTLTSSTMKRDADRFTFYSITLHRDLLRRKQLNRSILMKFDNSDGIRFPKFKNYLVFDFGHLALNDKIIKGLMKWGKMSREQARLYIIPGSGPKITILDDPGGLAFGTKRWRDFPTSVNLASSLVQAFELKEALSPGDAKQNVFAITGRGQRIYRVGLSIIEQLIQGHLFIFSQDVDDLDATTVSARILQFEDEVYGGIKFNI